MDHRQMKDQVILLFTTMLTHKQKQKLARKLITREELRAGINLFDSKAWKLRQERVKRQIIKREKKEKNLKLKKASERGKNE